MAEVVDARGTRSRDRKGTQFEWQDIHILKEFDDKYGLAYIDHPDDLAALGRTMGHCAGTHFIWACEEKIWYFFTVVTLDDMQPHTTLHAKDMKWVGKEHPRDSAEFPYDNGYGAKGNVPLPRPKDGGYYPTFRDVCEAFEKVGKKYEAGKYRALDYGSRTYELPKDYREPLANFNGRYGRNIIVEKPVGVGDETWAAYQKAIQAVKAEFDKNCGAVQVVGRTFKFDKKNLVVLSFSGKGDYSGYGDNLAKYRAMHHEFFIECNKKGGK